MKKICHSPVYPSKSHLSVVTEWWHEIHALCFLIPYLKNVRCNYKVYFPLFGIILLLNIHPRSTSSMKVQRRIVLCERLSLFIFTDSRQTLAERTVAKHLCAGTEQWQSCWRLVMCRKKRREILNTHIHRYAAVYSHIMQTHNHAQKDSLIMYIAGGQKVSFKQRLRGATAGKACWELWTPYVYS